MVSSLDLGTLLEGGAGRPQPQLQLRRRKVPPPGLVVLVELNHAAKLPPPRESHRPPSRTGTGDSLSPMHRNVLTTPEGSLAPLPLPLEVLAGTGEVLASPVS